MFNELRDMLEERDSLAESTAILLEMTTGGALEDPLLDGIVISPEEEKKIKDLVDKIPDGNLNDDSSGEISPEELAKAAKEQPDPSVEDLLD